MNNNFKLGAVIDPPSPFGGWSMERELYDYIREHIPDNSTLLELGSGAATEELAKNYTMFSIEHNWQFINKYKTTYIYAPIVGNWYDPEVVKIDLPAKYNAILIDGPPGDISDNRIGFFDNIDLFNTNVMLLFDDTNRTGEMHLFNEVLTKLNPRKSIHFNTFSVILPK